MSSKFKALARTIQDEFYELEAKVMMHKVNGEQLENSMKLLEKNLEEFTLEIMSCTEQKKLLELKADKLKQETCKMQSTHSVPVYQDNASSGISEGPTVATQHDNPSSSVIPSEANTQSTMTVTSSSQSLMPQWLRNNQEFAELQSCYDDILRNMPNDYMQTVQTLECHLCDLHVSAVFECSSASGANGTILECLTEHAVYKAHILEFCERLLLITNAPGLMEVVENLRESVMINMQGTHLQQEQVHRQPQIGGVEVFSKLKPQQFTTIYVCYVVVDLLKKYYHRLLTNMMPEDVRNINVNKAAWTSVDIASLSSLSNKQFLDLLITKTQNNHQLLRFCSTLSFFMDISSDNNMIKVFKNDLIAVFKCSASTYPNPSAKNFDSATSTNNMTVGMKNNQDFLQRCGLLSFKGIALLQKYYNKFLDYLPTDCFVTLEKLCELEVVISNDFFNHLMSCSGSQECNKEILHLLIESNIQDIYLLGFSFTMQVLTKESNVAVLFRDDCFETLAEDAASTPHLEMGAFFPPTSPGTDGVLTDNADHQPSISSLRSLSSQISIENNTKLPSSKLPANYSPCPELLKKVTAAILETDITTSSEVTVIIRGIGGIGKSTIAKAVCHKQSIKEHFTDGFVWISLAPPHNVTEELRKIYNSLTNQPIEGSLSFVKEKISNHLKSTTYKLLVILDDVWNADDALVYIKVFQSYKMLVTTRKLVIHSEIRAKHSIDVKPMELVEAVKLLTLHIDALSTLDDSSKAMLHKLAQDLHCWPLLLNLVRTQLYIYCTEQEMSPEKAVALVTQKISENFTAFDQSSRETAVKSCLEASLNLLPKQDIRILRCIVLTLDGFGSYAIKDTVATVSKTSVDLFNACIANLWSHGLIELIDMPVYPTNQCISCIGVNHIVAHYIIETLPLEQVYEMLSSIDDCIDFDNLMKVYNQEKNFFENNVSACLLYFIPNTLSYLVRVASLLAFLLNKVSSDSSQATTDHQLIMENMYSTMGKDCALIISMVMENKHNDAIEWLKQHFKSHPLLYVSGNSFIDKEVISLEELAELPHCLSEISVGFTNMHKCIVFLTKVKASDEDIRQVMECVVTALNFLMDCE